MDAADLSIAAALAGLLLAGPILALVLLARVRRLERRVGDLLEKDPGRTAGSARVDPAAASVEGVRKASPAAVPREAPAIAAARSRKVPAVEVTSPAVERPAGSDLETRIGARWLNRVGAVALLLAAAFFLKHAFEHPWLGPAARVVLGLLGGAALLAGGEVAHRRRVAWFGQGITGAGLGILYLSIFAAFGFYDLLPQIAAFGLMALITAAGAALAVRYDAVAIAVLAVLGGLLTPPVLATGEDRQVALLTYVGLLDGGVLLVAARRRWRALNLLAFAGTVVLFIGWADRFYVEDAFPRTFAFLLAFFLLFAAAGLLHNLVHRRRTTPADLALLLLAPAVAAGGALGLLEPAHHGWVAATSLAAAGFYLACGGLARRRSPDDRYLARVLLGLSITFLTAAVPAQVSGNGITVAWLVESLALLVLGFRESSPATRAAALAVLVLAGFRVLFLDGDVDPASYTVVWNTRVGSSLLASVVCGASAWLYRRHAGRVAAAERYLVPILGLAPVGLVGILLTREVWTAAGLHGTTQDQHLALSVAWGLYAGLLLGVGFLRSLPLLRWIGLGVLGLTTAKVFLVDLSELSTAGRIVSFLALGMLSMVLSFAYQRRRRPGGAG